MRIKPENYRSADARGEFIPARQQRRRRRDVAPPRRSTWPWPTSVGVCEKLRRIVKGDLTILVWPAGTPCLRRRKQRKLALDNLWPASHRRGTGLAVITKVNNAFPASNGVTPFTNKFDSTYVPGMWNVALRRASTERENEEIVTIITDSFFAAAICSAPGGLHFRLRSLISCGTAVSTYICFMRGYRNIFFRTSHGSSGAIPTALDIL